MKKSVSLQNRKLLKHQTFPDVQYSWCNASCVFVEELTRKEVEYVSLSRDTTEMDLKQRREIRSNSAFHIDQVN